MSFLGGFLFAFRILFTAWFVTCKEFVTYFSHCRYMYLLLSMTWIADFVNVSTSSVFF